MGGMGGMGGGGGPSASGLYDKNSEVIRLNEKNWPFNGKESDIAKKRVWFIEFYSPSCGHCQALTPAFTQLAQKSKGTFKVAALNCQSPDAQALCQKMGIKSFPTLMLFGSNSHDKPEEYRGSRSAAAMYKFATSKIPTFVKVMSPSSLSSALSSPASTSTTPSILFLSASSSSPTPLMNTLSSLHHEKAHLVLSSSSSSADKDMKALMTQLGVKSLPAVVIKQGDLVSVYNGEVKLKPMHDWITKTLADVKKKAPSSSAASQKSDSVLPVLTRETLKAMETRKGINIISILPSGPMALRSVTRNLEQLATKYHHDHTLSFHRLPSSSSSSPVDLVSLLQSSFKLPPPSSSEPVVVAFQGTKGKYVVMPAMTKDSLSGSKSKEAALASHLASFVDRVLEGSVTWARLERSLKI